MDFVESVTLELPKVGGRLVEFEDKRKALVIEVAAIHEGLTANFNNYARTELENSVEAWVLPYPKPVILNHDPDSESIGRVMAAKMDKEGDGVSFTRLQIGIMDPAAMERVMDQRYLTGSVGGKAGEVLCSICGKDWANASMFDLPCRHERGTVYKGKLCHFEMKQIAWKEYSFVNVPADQRSGVRSIGASSGEDVTDNGENVQDRWVKAHFLSVDMGKESVVEISESGDRNLLAEMKRREASPYYHILRGSYLTVLALSEAESEENKSMAHEEDEDILEATESLSADLAANAADPEEDPTVAPEDAELEAPADEEEEEPTAEDGDEPVVAAEEEPPAEEDEDEEAASGEEEDDASASSSPEGQEHPHDDETPLPQDREGDSDELVTETEESAIDTELDAEVAVQERVSALEAEVVQLSEDNTKLRTALKRMLAERVVESKIAAGLVEKDQREVQITEHLERTASSLADSLRDLAKFAPVNRANIGENLNIDGTVGADGDDGKRVVTNGTEDQENTPEPEPEEQYVTALTDTLMGRRRL